MLDSTDAPQTMLVSCPKNVKNITFMAFGANCHYFNFNFNKIHQLLRSKVEYEYTADRIS